MKKESLDEMVKLATILNMNETIETSVVKESLLRIINIEKSETKIGKFDLWKFVSKDVSRPIMCCIHHEDGFKVASDSHILVKVKADYTSDMECKDLQKDGKIIDREDGHSWSRYPNYNSVIKDTIESCDKTYEIDINKVKGFIKEHKSYKKVYKYIESSRYRFKDCNKVFFTDLFDKIIPFLEEFGTCTMHYNDNLRKPVYFKADDNILILMPISINIENLDDMIVDESHLVYDL